MNFSEFLVSRRMQKNLKSSTEHFESLGGKKSLSISLRQFQEIEAGRAPPSEKLFFAISKQISSSEKKPFVIAYFKSIHRFHRGNSSADIIDYLESNLQPELPQQSDNIFDDSLKHITYSAEQLEYLTTNEQALRFHKRLLLSEGVARDSVAVSDKVIKELLALELIQVSKNIITASENVYRIPNYNNSNPKVVGKATDYILKHVDAYVSREGSENQELSYAFQMVDPEIAPRIVEQMKAFKSWVQSHASAERKNTVPVLFLGLAKELEERELIN